MILAILLNLFLLQVDPTPDILVIILDDVGIYDIDRVELPNIDFLANNGLSFRRAYASPTCSPGRSTLMFSNYYDRDRGSICKPVSDRTPDINWLSLPKIFKSKGYSTGMFGKWHLGTNTIGVPGYITPLLHGFDIARACIPLNVVDDSCDPLIGQNYDSWVRFDAEQPFIEDTYNTIVVRNQFMLWWQKKLGPKFAYLALQAPHNPFHNPPTNLVPNPPIWPEPGVSPNRNKYEKMLMSADTVLGQLAQVVDFYNTYIILVADNGTPIAGPGQNANKIKTTTFEGGIKVPFIISGPGIQPGTSESLVSLVDVLPTLAEIIGFDMSSQQIDGKSLVPIFVDPSYVVHDHIFSSIEEDNAIIQDRYKLRNVDGVEQFYDLLLDQTESIPLDPLLIDPLIVQSLRDQMTIYLNRGL